MRLFSKTRHGYKRTIEVFGFKYTYDKKSERKIIKEILSENPNNLFLRDLFNYYNEFPKNILEKYQNHYNAIDKYLYQKLNSDDQKLFIRRLLKRWQGTNTATMEETELINNYFEKAKEIYAKRTSKDEAMSFNIGDKKVKFISDTEIITGDETIEERLMHYYEPTHAFFLTEYIQKGFEPNDGQAILDCGAAHGDTAILFKTKYPNSPVYSFECTAKNIDLFRKNIKLNGLDNVYIEKGFLWSKSGEAYFDEKTNQITETKIKNCHKIKTVSIDEYVREKNIQNIGLIKFDIEGGEQEALKDAINTIKTQKPLLAVPIYHLDSDVYEIPKILDSLGLKMTYSLKWTEKLVWGMDCVLFVRFE